MKVFLIKVHIKLLEHNQMLHVTRRSCRATIVEACFSLHVYFCTCTDGWRSVVSAVHSAVSNRMLIPSGGTCSDLKRVSDIDSQRRCRDKRGGFPTLSSTRGLDSTTREPQQPSADVTSEDGTDGDLWRARHS